MRDMSINMSNNTNPNSYLSVFEVPKGQEISEADFIKILQTEEQKEIDAAALALHELLNMREKKILEKGLRLMSGRVIGSKKDDGSYDIQPIGSFIAEDAAKTTLSSGVWRSINCVSIFQNLEAGDEVIILSYATGNKVNSMIIGVHQQKNKKKFQELLSVMGSLVEDNKKLLNLITEFEKYKKETDKKIKNLENDISSLKSRVSSLESSSVV